MAEPRERTEEERDERARLADVFRAYKDTGDIRLRSQLVEAHLGIAEHLARRFEGRGEPFDDLLQVASLGLVKAVDRFDPALGNEFSTFAVPTIVGELKRYFRDHGWGVRVPRRVQELHLRVRSLAAELTQELGRSPTVAQLAHAAGVREDDVVEALDAGQAYRTSTIDRSSGDGDEPLAHRLGAEDGEMIDVERRAALEPLLEQVAPRERTILYLRFFEGRTQAEIADVVGISQMHVSRLLRRTLEELSALASDADGNTPEALLE